MKRALAAELDMVGNNHIQLGDFSLGLWKGIDMEKTTSEKQTAERQRKSDRFGWND